MTDHKEQRDRLARLLREGLRLVVSTRTNRVMSAAMLDWAHEAQTYLVRMRTDDGATIIDDAQDQLKGYHQ